MEKYSWYTGKETKKSWILGYRYYSRVEPDECGYFAEHNYRSLRKGGHTHNHLYNVALRKVFRSKNRRDVSNNEKRHFRKVWEMNLKISYHNSFCEFMEARAKKIKEGM